MVFGWFDSFPLRQSLQYKGLGIINGTFLVLCGEMVTVKADSKDRYDRHIGTLFAGGKIINEWTVYHGWAWHEKTYTNSPLLDKLEQAAQSRPLG